MLNAFGLGLLAQSSLLFAGLLVCWVTVPRRLVGILAGFGAGAMLAAISFDLVAEAEDLDSWQFALWMLVGVTIFLLGDHLVERKFGDEGTGGSMGIVVGSVVDGVPESIILGVQLATGLPVSASFLAAVLISNVPQAIAPSADLAAAGWGPGRLGRLWLLVVLACGVAASLGFVAAEASSAVTGARMAALAAGGLLAMLTNSLMPFAYERGGEWAGAATVVGFCLALGGQ
jgi:zinc transporter, ZIP family